MTEGIYTRNDGSKCVLIGVATDVRNGDNLAIYNHLGDKSVLIRNAADFDQHSESRIFTYFSPARHPAKGRVAKWVRIGGCVVLQCTRCKELSHEASNYCPHCGAVMSKNVLFPEEVK